MRKKFNYWLGLIVLLMAGTASWAFYGLINLFIEDVLLKFGIINQYLQFGIVFIIVFIAFLIVGFSFKESISKILK